jgi:Alpha/beta hydrolase domain
VGVSAQTVGIYGSENSLAASLALKNADPVRYGPLNHPGDQYSYDIYSQAGMAVWRSPDVVLGGLQPQRVIAIGESQSAFRLTTYLNAVAPTADVYDGYLVHSRGATGAPLAEGVQMPDPTLIRDDLTVPVLNFSSETDLVGDRLGYARARQPDTDLFRGWEAAGTAHADAYNLGIGDVDDGSGAADAELFAAMEAPPAEVYGGIISCATPINTGPHTYVLRTAVSDLDRWIRTGEPPRSMPQLELAADGSIARDPLGNALGGIRTPQVDVPIASLSGVGQTGSRFCGLFGTTVPLTTPQVVPAVAADHDDFVTRWTAALSAAVDAGAVLPADAQVLEGVVRSSNVLR